MLEFLAAEPSLARLCMVEALVAGPVVVERYDSRDPELRPLLPDRPRGPSPEVLSRLSPTTEEALVGGMISLISRRIIAGKAEELEESAPRPCGVHPDPYLGSAEAVEVAREG